MRVGQILVDGAETFTFTRSAADGRGCELDFTLGPRASGPPLHTHEEPEVLEVLEGAITFTLDGVERTFSAGDSCVIPPGCAHTFWNPSRTDTMRARVVHSARFERLVDQLAAGGPTFLRLSLYLASVDPRGTFMVSPVVRGTMRAAALLARLGGVRIAPATGPYGLDGR